MGTRNTPLIQVTSGTALPWVGGTASFCSLGAVPGSSWAGELLEGGPCLAELLIFV